MSCFGCTTDGLEPVTSIGEVCSWVKLDVDMLVVTLFPGPDVSLMSTWIGVVTTN